MSEAWLSLQTPLIARQEVKKKDNDWNVRVVLRGEPKECKSTNSKPAAIPSPQGQMLGKSTKQRVHYPNKKT